MQHLAMSKSDRLICVALLTCSRSKHKNEHQELDRKQSADNANSNYILKNTQSVYSWLPTKKLQETSDVNEPGLNQTKRTENKKKKWEGKWLIKK